MPIPHIGVVVESFLFVYQTTGGGGIFEVSVYPTVSSVQNILATCMDKGHRNHKSRLEVNLPQVTERYAIDDRLCGHPQTPKALQPSVP
jgi:hypothetical protein